MAKSVFRNLTIVNPVWFIVLFHLFYISYCLLFQVRNLKVPSFTLLVILFTVIAKPSGFKK